MVFGAAVGERANTLKPTFFSAWVSQGPMYFTVVLILSTWSLVMNPKHPHQDSAPQTLKWLREEGLAQLLQRYPSDPQSLRALAVMGLGLGLSGAAGLAGLGGLGGLGEGWMIQALSLSLSAWGARRASQHALASLQWPNVLPSELGLQSDPSPHGMGETKRSRAYLMGYTVDKGLPIHLSAQHLSRHFMAAGMTGVGKTVSSTLLMAQQMSKGGGVLWVDGKLDPENMEMFFHLAKWLGREGDVRIIHPSDSSLSNTYNFIAHGTPDQVASRILSTIASTQNNAGSDYYKQAANQGLMCLLGAIQWLGLSYNCMDLAILLTHPKALLELDQMINARMHLTRSRHEPCIASFKLFLESCRSAHPLSGKMQIDTRKLRELFGGVAGRLFVYGSGSCGEVTHTYHSEVNLYEGMKEGQLIYCALPTMGQHLSAQNFGKMLLGDLRSAIAKLQELPKASRPDPPFLIWLDEVASYGNASALATPFQQARSAHIALGVGFQEHASVEELGPSFLSTILGNTYNKLLFKPSDPHTTKAWAEMIGRHRVLETQVSEQSTRAKGFNFLGLNLNPRVSVSQSKTFSHREREEYRLSVERLARLDVGQAVLLHGASQLYDLRIPKLSFEGEMKRELGGVVIQRSWAQLKKQTFTRERSALKDQHPGQDMGAPGPKTTDQEDPLPLERGFPLERGLFFYKKYETFLSELAVMPWVEDPRASQEDQRKRKFQKLGSLHPEG